MHVPIYQAEASLHFETITNCLYNSIVVALNIEYYIHSLLSTRGFYVNHVTNVERVFSYLRWW